MPRRKKVKEITYPEGWEVSFEYQVNGRNLEPGTEVSIKNERGRFSFVKHVKTENSEWIDVIGGPPRVKMFRSFAIDKVKTVHWKKKMRQK